MEVYAISPIDLTQGKRRLAGDTARAANSDEVKELRLEARGLKEVVAIAIQEGEYLNDFLGFERQCWRRKQCSARLF